MIRIPAVAGAFYPANSEQLKHDIQIYLDDAIQTDLTPKAIIAPHAGYIYSGPIAGSAYSTLLPIRSTIKKVVLLGPSHHVAFHGLSAPTADIFRTPLGDIGVDQQTIQQLATLSNFHIADEPHRQEHSLEVQLPFLQHILDDFTLLPLVVGNASATTIAEVLEQVWGGEETLIVISSDLSHYLPYTEAQEVDQHSSQAIEQLDETALVSKNACGHMPINGLLHIAKQKNLQGKTIDLRNSGDTAGDKSRVVGYGAYIFSENK